MYFSWKYASSAAWGLWQWGGGLSGLGTQNEKFNSIQILRGLAALLVVIDHTLQHTLTDPWRFRCVWRVDILRHQRLYHCLYSFRRFHAGKLHAAAHHAGGAALLDLHTVPSCLRYCSAEPLQDNRIYARISAKVDGLPAYGGSRHSR